MIFYTDEESRTLRTAVYGAMVLVSDADPGPVVEERFAGIRALAGLSGDMRGVLNGARMLLPDGPNAEATVLDALRRSMKILSSKAPDEAEAFPSAVLAICREVATADGRVVDAEDAMVAKVEAALIGTRSGLETG